MTTSFHGLCMYQGFHWGAGAGVGSVVGGVLYQSLQARATFLISSAMAAISLMLGLALMAMAHYHPHLLAPSPPPQRASLDGTGWDREQGKGCESKLDDLALGSSEGGCRLGCG